MLSLLQDKTYLIILIIIIIIAGCYGHNLYINKVVKDEINKIHKHQ